MGKRCSLCLAVLLLLAAGARNGLCNRRPVLRVPRDAPTTGRYIIALKEKTSVAELHQVLTKVLRISDDAKVYGYVEKVAKAFTVELSSYALELVRHLPEVDYIEEEGIATGTQDKDLLWYLDRIDQPQLPRDYSYNPIGDGSGVDVYILDSGIDYDHEEFEYRAKFGGYDAVDEYEGATPSSARNGSDCHGHGTHVASLCGGKTYGSAKKVRLYSIRVLQCDNAAPWSTVLEGIDYVASVATQRRRPAIISMSLGGSFYRSMNDAVASVVRNQGIHVITVAGNGQQDSCRQSPSSSSDAVTVAGTRNGDGLYLRGSGTNYGACVDIFAPGELIRAADHRCRNCSKFLSGTSMAGPIVSGVAAIHLSHQPLLTPAELKQKLIDESIKNVIDYTGMPNNYKQRTPNRLVYIPGSCGGNTHLRNHDTLTSPKFPQAYPNNLHCVWTITGDNQQNVKLTFTYLSLERNYDVIKIYNGFSPCQSNLIAELTGELGNVSLSYRSTGKVLTLVFITDSDETRGGFNATYTKLYAGTNLTVPPDPSLPTSPPNTPLKTADIKTFIKWRTKLMKNELPNWERRGYKVIWATTYQLGPNSKSYFDVVLSNSSTVDVKGFFDLDITQLNRTIQNMTQYGYSVCFLSDRKRGNRPVSPHYTVVFKRDPQLIETKVYLRDSIAAYLERLARKKREGYQLVSHSFCAIDGTLEAASVYKRDRRLAFNITVENQQRWKSYHNLSFYDFTRTALHLGRQNYTPSFVETYEPGQSGISLFAAIFTEHTPTTKFNWFRWGLNTTSAIQYVNRWKSLWDPVITTGYNYLNNMYHFIEFKRRSIY